jgi:RNA polymerase sigma-70 factor (ECF subfamily)
MHNRNAGVLIGDTVPDHVLSLELLLAKEGARLLSYLDRHIPADVRRVVDPSDILQDTFLEAFRRLGEFTENGNSSASRWLITIARNQLISNTRRHRAAKRGARAATQFDGESYDARSMILLLEDLAVYERTPSQSAFAHELLGVIEHYLKGLPAAQQTAVRLRYMDGLSVREIACRMGRTGKAVRNLCNRGLSALRGQMQSASVLI